MTNDPIDVELKATFAALKGHDEALAPPFGTTLARAMKRPGQLKRRATWRSVAAGGLMAALLVGAWVLHPSQPPLEPGPSAQLAWRAPTDGLLDSPPLQARGLAWNSLPTTALGSPSFNHLPELR